MAWQGYHILTTPQGSPGLHSFWNALLAEDTGPLPRVKRSPDPGDNFLLAMAEAGKADYLVTGDKSDLLALSRHHATEIVSARQFTVLLG